MADDDWMFDDEDEEKWLEEWAEVDRQAAVVLRDACSAELEAPPPQPDLKAATELLRGGVAAGHWPFDYFVAACGWTGPLPEDDVESWVMATAASISPPNDPGTDLEEQSAVAALQHADWLGMAVGLVRRGTGASFSATTAQRDIDTLPEIDGASDDPEGDLVVLGTAVEVLTPLWQALGILDEDRGLTDLGRWGLPHGLLVTWSEGGEPSAS